MWAWTILYAWVSEEPAEPEADGHTRWEQRLRPRKMPRLWGTCSPSLETWFAYPWPGDCI